MSRPVTEPGPLYIDTQPIPLAEIHAMLKAAGMPYRETMIARVDIDEEELNSVDVELDDAQ